MPNKLRKIKKLSIGKKNAEQVATYFGCSLGLVYRALKDGTSDQCMEIREYVENNKKLYRPKQVTEYRIS